MTSSTPTRTRSPRTGGISTPTSSRTTPRRCCCRACTSTTSRRCARPRSARSAGSDAGTDGAQDHDLALRMVRAGAAVSHVPAVLYHWRAWSGSTAVGIQAKPWAQVAAADVQRAHLEAIGYPGVVEPSAVPGLNEVHPGITGEPLVSIVIPTISQRVAPDSALTLVEQCLRSIRRDGGWANVELVVVHTNEPTARTARAAGVARRQGRDVLDAPVQLLGGLQPRSDGAASGDYLLLLNDDTQILRPGSIRAMLEFAQLDGVGAVGARLTYPDGRNQHSGILFLDSQPTHPHHGAPPSDAGYFGSIITPRNYLAVTGAALMTPRVLFESIGGLDAGWPRDYQDIDYCLRLGEAGYRIVYTPYAHFTHFENASLERSAPNPADTASVPGEVGSGRWRSRPLLLPDARPADYQPVQPPMMEPPRAGTCTCVTTPVTAGGTSTDGIARLAVLSTEATSPAADSWLERAGAVIAADPRIASVSAADPAMRSIAGVGRAPSRDTRAGRGHGLRVGTGRRSRRGELRTVGPRRRLRVMPGGSASLTDWQDWARHANHRGCATSGCSTRRGARVSGQRTQFGAGRSPRPMHGSSPIRCPACRRSAIAGSRGT